LSTSTVTISFYFLSPRSASVSALWNMCALVAQGWKTFS
jgi:hypothetical protein